MATFVNFTGLRCADKVDHTLELHIGFGDGYISDCLGRHLGIPDWVNMREASNFNVGFRPAYDPRILPLHHNFFKLIL